MRSTIACVLILSLIAGTYAQSPQLSSSFAFQGTSVQIAGGVTSTLTPYNQAIDVSRMLQVDDIAGTVGGVDISTIGLLSVNDGMGYVVIGGVCNASVITAADFQDNFWGAFDNAV